MSEEVGGGEVPGIEPIEPEWRDGALQGLGYFFRDETADGHQTLLALRCGSAWGHHHHDEGSLQFFARGEQLIADSAFGHNQPHDRKFIAPGHSAWGPEAAPRFDVFWRFNRGWITRSKQEGLFPFAVAWTPVYLDGHDMRRPTPLWPHIRHWRTVVKLAPDAFLIVDSSDATVSQVVRFHVPDNAVTVEGLNVAAHGGATQVHLIPLEGVQSVDASRTDAPYSEADTAFSTREICFSTGRARRSIILLAATASGQFIRTVNFEAGCRLVGPDWNATVLWADDALVLRDEATGAEVTFGNDILQAE